MKIKLITPVMLALFLGVMLIASVSACPVKSHGFKHFRCKPLRCELSIMLNETLPGWEGTVSGDIEGSYVWILKESTVEGTTEYYLGTWVIETDCGSISGFDAGVFSYETLEWVAFGRVTAATGKWSYLVGSFMWNSGTATLGEVITGEGKLTILPCWHW